MTLKLAVAMATALAIFLRTYGITQQVVIDDEWHAIHMLLFSTYGIIFNTFGSADHSIPLTLLYKAMADTVGLAEGRLRIPQIVCGVALVPLASGLAWRATRDAPAAALLGFLVAAAPFLVMWSRFARPYSITLLLTVICIAAIWRWRSARSRGYAACAAIAAALSAWFHPAFGLFPAAACLFVFVEDTLADPAQAPRPSWQSLKLGCLVALAMLVPLTAPLIEDWESLEGKSGGDRPDWAAMERLFAIVWGGIPTPAVIAACAISAWGLVVLFRRDRALALYLAVLGVFPGTMLWLSGALWMHQGQNFLRYQLPVAPLVLFLGSVGAMSIVRASVAWRPEAAAWIAGAFLAGAYLMATPTLAQVVRLGTWYGSPEYHWDYRHRWMSYRTENPAVPRPPAFYARLQALAPGTAPIIEAPFVWNGFLTPYAFYARFHEQPETFGMMYDLCLAGIRTGDLPRDRRFRFRKFVALDDKPAVLRTGAHYLLLNRRPPPQQIGSTYDDARCLAKVKSLYGEPVEIDDGLAVFDLNTHRRDKK